MSKNEHSLQRRDVVARLLADRGDLLVVSGLGSPTYDCAAAGDHPLNFYLWGAMGSAITVGLGLALAQPERRVLVVTGDGELLMGLGALATAAVMRPRNLAIAVMDNERYGETGMQATHTAAGVDLAGMAAKAGFAQTATVAEESGVASACQLLRTAAGPVLVVFKVAANRDPLVLPPRDGAYLKHRFREALLGREALA
jgi:thiamine pyrophosphate-dependent acetolactate synthase large subunit-like protein